MAPQQQDVEVTATEEKQRICSILFIVAMQKETEDSDNVRKVILLEMCIWLLRLHCLIEEYRYLSLISTAVGLRQALSSFNLAKELKLKLGKLSTGDSLDMSPQDEASIIANDATVKDMEGAAVAYVADLFKVPVIFLKAVTDIRNGEKTTTEEFLQNLAAVTAALELASFQVVDFINGKSLSDL